VVSVDARRREGLREVEADRLASPALRDGDKIAQHGAEGGVLGRLENEPESRRDGTKARPSTRARPTRKNGGSGRERKAGARSG